MPAAPRGARRPGEARVRSFAAPPLAPPSVAAGEWIVTPLDPVQLLLVQTAEEFGASERVLWELATRLPSARYVVDAWLSTSPGLDELAWTLKDRGIGVERPKPVRSRWDLGSRFQIWSALRRRHPTLVHVHTTWADLPDQLAGLTWLAGVERLVVTVQGAIERVPDPSLAL